MKKLLLVICLFTSCTYSHLQSTDDNKPLTVVIFGATGDLAARKLFPALFNLLKENALDKDVKIVGIGRREWQQSEFHDTVYQSLTTFSRNTPLEKEWDEFKEHLIYQKMNFTDASDYAPLARVLKEQNQDTLYFLATESSYFQPIIEHLHDSGLLDQKQGFSRVIIEKPFGEDLDTALELQSEISKYLEEEQIYRMDHYLGKEGVFKLAKFRLEDNLYEDILNQNYVTNVELILSETIGIGTRANFYEKTGHLRDVVQNHAMQVFAFAMMDRPESLGQNEILAEKANVLSAIRSPAYGDILRAQYSNSATAKGYREESGVPADSTVETFVQAQLWIDTERWTGVPFTIRSGKRLPEQLTQVKYFFKENPWNLDSITIVIQPNPRILISQNQQVSLFPIQLDPALERREGYENQILAATKGDKTGFVALDEALISWRLFSPILNRWRLDPNILFYQAGTWPLEGKL